MVFRIFTVCILSLWANLLIAAPVAATEPDDITALRLAIKHKQYNQVEQLLSATQADLRQGKARLSQQRDQFQVFSTTDPDVADFVSAWREQNPQSIYAKTAQAWLYFTIGRNVRGSKFIYQTYPVALEVEQNMHHEALELATQAFATDNMLISASDALISLSLTTNTQNSALEVLHQVMENQPNWGTLWRALHMTNRQYHGSAEMADWMCETYGPMIQGSEDNMLRACITWTSFTYYGNRRDEIREWMKETPDLWYDHYRVQDMLRNKTASQTDIAIAMRYFKESTTTDIYIARKFDRFLAHQPGSEPVEQIVLARAKVVANEVLTHDPYNLAALKHLLMTSFSVEVTENGIDFTVIGSPTKDEKHEYPRRQLLAAPYNSDFWEEMARTVPFIVRDLSVEKILAAADMRGNAIVYSNHSPDSLLNFIYQKLLEMRQLDAWQEANGVALQQDINFEEIYACPLIRTERLLAAVLESGARMKRYSKVAADTQAKLDGIRAVAETDDHCTHERTSPLQDIIFEPVEVDLSVVN